MKNKIFFFFFFLLIYIQVGACAFISTTAGSFLGHLGAEIVSEDLKHNKQCNKSIIKEP
jgi:hypothetical protein